MQCAPGPDRRFRKSTSRGFLASSLIAIVGITAGAARAEDWPQFRGHNGTSISTESRNLPVEFSATSKVLWQHEVGEGVNCPVVASGRVFITGMTSKQTFTVFGFDAATGTKLWEQSFETGPLPTITIPNTQASSTVCADAERVYVHFSTLGLKALDVKSGSLVWEHKVPKAYYLLGWGTAQAPMLYQDKLIYCQDDDLGSFILALDKKTGTQIWRTPREDMLAGYSVPVIVTANGRTDLVVAGSGKMQGYDPNDGKLIWTCNSLLRTIMVSPVVKDDMIYISLKSFGDTNRILKEALLEWKDTNQDKKLSKSELDPAFYEKFDKADKNHDGFLEGDELNNAFQSRTNMAGGGKIVQAIRGGGRGDVTKTHIVWNLTNIDPPSDIASPLLYEGKLFLVKNGGMTSAYDAKDGTVIWSKKRIDNEGNYYASPVAADGKVYVTGEAGAIAVLQLGKKPKVLSVNDIGESCVATPAIADNRLFVRTVKKLYCFSEEAK